MFKVNEKEASKENVETDGTLITFLGILVLMMIHFTEVSFYNSHRCKLTWVIKNDLAIFQKV